MLRSDKCKLEIQKILAELKPRYPRVRISQKMLLQYIGEYSTIMNPYMIKYHSDERYKITYKKLQGFLFEDFELRLINKK